MIQMDPKYRSFFNKSKKEIIFPKNYRKENQNQKINQLENPIKIFS